jgi:hypothetical protein
MIFATSYSLPFLLLLAPSNISKYFLATASNERSASIFFRAASLICFLASRFRIKKSALAAAAAISLGGTYSPFALAAFSFPPPIQAIGDQ